MTIRKIVVVLFLTSLFSQKIQNFDITFLGMEVAKVKLTSHDSTYNFQQARFVEFSANTSSLAYSIFPTTCTYQMFVDSTNSIKHFSKETKQPRVVNKTTTVSRGGKVFYKDTNIELPPKIFNIFTFLEYISQHDLSSILEQTFHVEREGLIFDATIITSKNQKYYELFIEPNVYEHQTSVFENTDIFSWAVFKSGAVRKIWIDAKTNSISKCEFTFGLWKLTARNLNYEID